MPEMHSKQPGFTYSACSPFTENKIIIIIKKRIGDSRFIKTNYIKLVLNMIWLMEILKI